MREFLSKFVHRYTISALNIQQAKVFQNLGLFKLNMILEAISAKATAEPSTPSIWQQNSNQINGLNH